MNAEANSTNDNPEGLRHAWVFFANAADKWRPDLIRRYAAEGMTPPSFTLTPDDNDPLILVPFQNNPPGAPIQKRDETLEALMESGIDIDQRDTKGSTVLHHAARLDEPREAVTFLMANGARLLRDKTGQTPLELTLTLGKVDALFAFIKNGVSPDTMDRLPPLLAGKKVSGQVHPKGKVPLLYNLFAWGYRAPIFRDLLEKGANPNATTEEGFPLLPEVVRTIGGHRPKSDFVDLLVECGADLGAKGKDGLTALQWAHRLGPRGEKIVASLERLESEASFSSLLEVEMTPKNKRMDEVGL